MSRLMLASAVRRPRRTALLLLAIALGVGIAAGSMVLSDTVDAAYDRLARVGAEHAGVVVSRRAQPGSAYSAPEPISVLLLRAIRRLPLVADAYGQIEGPATFVDAGGHAVAPKGSVTLGSSYVPPPLGTLRFAAGTRPASPDQVAVDQGIASRLRVRIGDSVQVLTRRPAQTFRVSGILRTGASGGGLHLAVFSVVSARALYGEEGGVDRILVAPVSGVSAGELLAALRPLLGPEIVARPAGAQATIDARASTTGLGPVRDSLRATILLAVLVGALQVIGAFALTLAERGRELALVRVVGAGRSQVLKAAGAEAALLGLIGAVAGVGVGFGVATGMRGLLAALGFDLPAAHPVLAGRTVALCLVGGVLVSLVAGLAGAVTATSSRPLEALRRSRGSGEDRAAGQAPLFVAAACGVTGLALAGSTGGATSTRAPVAAVGGGLIVLALGVLAPRLVAPAARAVTRPLAGRDVTAGLAREAVARRPGRAALAAGSLALGLTLSLFVAVYLDGLRASARAEIDGTFAADLVIEARDAVRPLPGAAVRAAVLAPGIVGAASIHAAPGGLALPDAPRGARGSGVATTTLEGIDPSTLPSGYRFSWVSAPVDPSSLGGQDVVVERDTAARLGLNAGSEAVVVSETGSRLPVRVRGIYRDRTLLPGLTLLETSLDRFVHEPGLRAVMLRLGPGADRATAASQLTDSLRAIPDATVASAAELRRAAGGRLDRLLVLLYALLGLSGLLSLVALASALSLGVQERTREIGIMRALGMTPAQVRRMVRLESAVTALLGTLGGLALGLALAWGLVRASNGTELVFGVPWPVVAAGAGIGLLAGRLAAAAPGRRAARLDVLAAIADE